MGIPSGRSATSSSNGEGVIDTAWQLILEYKKASAFCLLFCVYHDKFSSDWIIAKTVEGPARQ